MSILVFNSGILCLISLASNSSRGTPLVSGILKITHSNCNIIMQAKNRNNGAAPNLAAIIGNTVVIIDANIQWVAQPKD